MMPPVLEPDFSGGKIPKRSGSPYSESNYSRISIDTNISPFPEVSVLSFASSKSQEPFFSPSPCLSPSPQPPNPFFRPCFPQKRPGFYRSPRFRFNQSGSDPLIYFGKQRDEHGILHCKPKLESFNSLTVAKPSRTSFPSPPLIRKPAPFFKVSPGPSWRNPNNLKPIYKKPRKTEGKQKITAGDCVKEPGIQTAIRQASPDLKLTEQQGRFIQAQLTEALDNTSNQTSPPRFLKSFYDQGVFWMVCADEKSKEWLIRNVKLLNDLWDDLDLTVETAKFPKRPIVYVDLPEVQKTIEILDRLKNQNKGLRTDSWLILNRQTFKSRQRVTFSIDMDSFEFLEARNFMVTWKLQSITFKVPSKGIKRRAGKWVRGSAGLH